MCMLLSVHTPILHLRAAPMSDNPERSTETALQHSIRVMIDDFRFMWMIIKFPFRLIVRGVNKVLCFLFCPKKNW